MTVTTAPNLYGPNTTMPALQGADPAKRAPVPSSGEDIAGAPRADSPDRAFGKLLTHRIADARAEGDAKARCADSDADAAAPADAKNDTLPGAKAVDASTSADPPAVMPDDQAHEPGAGDAAGTDLAAQMALASQWAGAAANHAPKVVRGGPGATDGDAKEGARVAPAMAPIDASALDARDAKASHVAGASAKAANPLALQAAASSEIARLAPDASVGAQPASIAPLPDALAGARAIDGGNVQAPSIGTTLAEALQQRVGTPAWSHEVGHAVLRMAASELQSASLSVNPEHLGPLDVRIRIDQGTAHLAFNAAHADTRHALESSRAVLEQLFTQQGLALGDCSVADTPPRRFAFDADPSSQGSRGGSGNETFGAADPSGNDAAMQTRRTSALGMVDTFA